MTRHIATTRPPDWDAILGVWGITRLHWGLTGAVCVAPDGGSDRSRSTHHVITIGDAPVEVSFVPAGDPLPAPHAVGVGVGGGSFDPRQRQTTDTTHTSASALVWRAAPDGPLTHAVEPLVRLVTDAALGNGSAAVATSQRVGIHALLRAWTSRRLPPLALVVAGMTLIDDLVAGEHVRVQADRALTRSVVYDSGRVIAHTGDAHATAAAFDRGALLVLAFDARAAHVTVVITGHTTFPRMSLPAVIAALHRLPAPPRIPGMMADAIVHSDGCGAGHATATWPFPGDIPAFIRLAGMVDAVVGDMI